MNKTLGLLTIAVAALLPPSVGMSQEVVHWEPTLESAQRLAAQTNRLVLIYFSGPSCVYCRRMEAEVLSQPGVAAAINADYVAVKVVADYFPTTAKRYSVTHLPTTVVTTPQGQWLDSKEGYVAANEYVVRLGHVALDAKRRSQAVVAQMPNGPTPPAMNQPMANRLVANGPMMNQPIANQPMANQPMVNQPIANQPPPMGQPPFGPTATANVPPGAAVPAGVSPPYGGSPNPIAPPTMAQQPPPAFQQQPPLAGPQNQQQSAFAGPQNNPAPPAVAGNPPVGLEGCCPVSLVEKQRWVAGDRRWGMYHRGRLYYFAGPEEQRRFFADPDRYAPMISGNDIVLATQGQLITGKRQYGVFYRNHVYLFATEATRAAFRRESASYANQPLEALRGGADHPSAQWR